MCVPHGARKQKHSRVLHECDTNKSKLLQVLVAEAALRNARAELRALIQQHQRSVETVVLEVKSAEAELTIAQVAEKRVRASAEEDLSQDDILSGSRQTYSSDSYITQGSVQTLSNSDNGSSALASGEQRPTSLGGQCSTVAAAAKRLEFSRRKLQAIINPPNVAISLIVSRLQQLKRGLTIYRAKRLQKIVNILLRDLRKKFTNHQELQKWFGTEVVGDAFTLSPDIVEKCSPQENKMIPILLKALKDFGLSSAAKMLPNRVRGCLNITPRGTLYIGSDVNNHPWMQPAEDKEGLYLQGPVWLVSLANLGNQSDLPNDVKDILNGMESDGNPLPPIDWTYTSVIPDPPCEDV